MNLPIEIINHIAQFVDYDTYNALKCTSKEVNMKVHNYDVLKKFSSKLVYLIFNESIAIEFKLSKSFMFKSKNKAIGLCIKNNPDKFTCFLCGFPIICTIEKDLIKHLYCCVGRDEM